MWVRLQFPRRPDGTAITRRVEVYPTTGNDALVDLTPYIKEMKESLDSLDQQKWPTVGQP
jgi:hypothetical protein